MTGGLDPDPLLTIDATPGVYAAHDRGGATAAATLTLVPRLQVLTGDGHPGAEIVDAVLAALLGDGFTLVQCRRGHVGEHGLGCQALA